MKTKNASGKLRLVVYRGQKKIDETAADFFMISAFDNDGGSARTTQLGIIVPQNAIQVAICAAQAVIEKYRKEEVTEGLTEMYAKDIMQRLGVFKRLKMQPQQ